MDIRNLSNPSAEALRPGQGLIDFGLSQPRPRPFAAPSEPTLGARAGGRLRQLPHSHGL